VTASAPAAMHAPAATHAPAGTPSSVTALPAAPAASAASTASATPAGVTAAAASAKAAPEPDAYAHDGSAIKTVGIPVPVGIVPIRVRTISVPIRRVIAVSVRRVSVVVPVGRGGDTTAEQGGSSPQVLLERSDRDFVRVICIRSYAVVAPLLQLGGGLADVSERCV